MYREAPIKNGMFDYNEFTKILKHGAKEKDEPWMELNFMDENYVTTIYTIPDPKQYNMAFYTFVNKTFVFINYFYSKISSMLSIVCQKSLKIN